MKDLRNRVNALRRKMALPLAVVRLRLVAEEFCLQWNAALACGQPAPQSHPLIGRVVGQGFRLPTFLALHNYLDRCRSRNTLPDCDELLRTLLPWAAASWERPKARACKNEDPWPVISAQPSICRDHVRARVYREGSSRLF